MHGLYCLSRPSALFKLRLTPVPAYILPFLVRISPATAKHKGQQANAPPFPVPSQYASPDLQSTLSLPPMPTPMTTQSISGPLATSATPVSGSNNSLHTASGSISSVPSLSSNSSTTTLSNASDEIIKTQNVVNPLLGSPPPQMPSNKSPTNPNGVNSITSTFAAQQVQDIPSSQTSVLSEEFSKHHAQARAILSNLIGPNGEQLSSSDPYNTTVFVGGLSPLISEDTLRTFFAPFGDIHYVRRSLSGFKPHLTMSLPCRSRFQLGKIAVSFSSSANRTLSGRSKRCKVFPSAAAESG